MPILQTLMVQRKKLSMGLIVLFVQLFLYVNADYIYGSAAPVIKDVFTVYFFLFLVAFVSLNAKLPTFKGDLGRQSKNFLIMFLGTALVMLGLGSVIPGELLRATVAEVTILTWAGYGLFHGFVKAYIEESVFRYAFPIPGGLGPIISSITFGLFHFGVASLTGVASPWFVVIYLSVLGYVWHLVYLRFGLIGSTASHFAYNLAALGTLPLIFGAVVM